MQVDAVQQGTADALAVALDHAGGAGAGAFGITKVTARTGLRGQVAIYS